MHNWLQHQSDFFFLSRNVGVSQVVADLLWVWWRLHWVWWKLYRVWWRLHQVWWRLHQVCAKTFSVMFVHFILNFFGRKKKLRLLFSLMFVLWKKIHTTNIITNLVSIFFVCLKPSQFHLCMFNIYLLIIILFLTFAATRFVLCGTCCHLLWQTGWLLAVFDVSVWVFLFAK